MDVQTLNPDTLSLIVANLDSHDAHCLSSTARIFHAVAREHALKDATLHSFANVVKFCHYMLHDAHDRLPSLRALRIQCFVDKAEWTADWYTPQAGRVCLWDLGVLVLQHAEGLDDVRTPHCHHRHLHASSQRYPVLGTRPARKQTT